VAPSLNIIPTRPWSQIPQNQIPIWLEWPLWSCPPPSRTWLHSIILLHSWPCCIHESLRNSSKASHHMVLDIDEQFPSVDLLDANCQLSTPISGLTLTWRTLHTLPSLVHMSHSSL
jgi:hypothetical protein